MRLFKFAALLGTLCVVSFTAQVAYGVDSPNTPKGGPELKEIFRAPAPAPKSGNFIGPTKPVKPGQTVILDYNGDLGLDPKFSVQPKPENFRIFKDFSGKPAILITPGDELAGKTIVVAYADNKDGKTVLETFAFDVTGLAPVPPPGPPTPVPVPVPDDPSKIKYYNDLKPAYQVSPDAAALDKLIEVYTEMSTTTFTKRSEAASVLKTITAKKIPDYPTLRKVRDTVQHLLERDIGTSDNDPFDNAKLQVFFKDVVAALHAVKTAK